MDVLSPLFQNLRLHARIDYIGGVCGRWAIDHNSPHAVWFHLVTKGDGWVHTPAWPAPLRVGEGDLVAFMPHAACHYLSWSPDECEFGVPGAARTSFDEGSTAFVCAAIELESPTALLWRLLPAELLLRRADAGTSLAALVGIIVDEARTQAPASAVLIEHLCDAFFVLILRHCLAHALCDRAVLAALRDARLEQVLNLMHREPARAWTLRELCRQAGVSRSALNERFTALVGCPPMDYLTRWRLRLAADWLRELGMSVERVAERCGYESVSAFSRAFKRHHGAAPGALRRAGGSQA